MSHVSNYLILPGEQISPSVDGIFEWEERLGAPIFEDGPRFCELIGWGGNKMPETEVWGAALNYFGLEQLAEWLIEKVRFPCPGNVRIVAVGPNDERARIYGLDDGRMVLRS